MADNQEEVVYSFEGDVGSLRQATQEAISLLDKFDATIKKTASKDTFSASKTSATSFQRVLNGLVKQVNTLTSSLNTAGSSIETSMPDGTAIVTAATKDFADVLDYLNSSTSTTSADLQLLTEVLRETKSSIDPIVARAQMLSSALKPLETLQTAQTLKTTGTAAQQTQKHFEAAAAAGFRVQDAYIKSGKSAAESAAVFLQASRSVEKITSIQSAVRRLQTEMNLLGARAKVAWDQFAAKIDPTGTKIQSFKDKTNTAFGQIKATIAKVSGIFKRVSTETDKTDSSFKKLSTTVGKVGSSLKSLNTHATSSHNAFKKLSGVTKGLKSAFQALTGLKSGDIFSEAADQSITFTENANLFKVAMGEAVDMGRKFVNQMSEIYGMDPSNRMRYAGNFYQLADAIDMPDAAAAGLSLSLVKATNDISSLFNVPIEKVFEDLSSGMQGMSRAVRKYGMDIRTTTLEQTALTLGITANVESMSEANRQGLRYITMMRQAKNASGDFARTIESPANQLKIFREQMSQLGRAIGDLFIEPLGIAIQYINGFVMALRMVINFLGSVLGLVSNISGETTIDADEVAQSVENIGSAAGGAAKKLKGLVAPFDELNVLASETEGGGGGGGGLVDLGTLDLAIAAEIESMELKLENIRMKALEVRDAFLDFFGFTVADGAILSWDASQLEENLINKFPEWTQTIQATFDNWTSIINSFGEVLKSLGGVAQSVWDKVVGFVANFVNDDTVSTSIEGLSSGLSGLADFINNNQSSIADFVIIVGALVAAFKGFSVISTLIGPVSSFISSCATALAPFASIIGWAAVIVAAIGALYVSSDQFASAFNDLVKSVGSGLSSMFGAFWETLQTVWQGIQRLWQSNIQPMIQELGTGLAPVLVTIKDLWEDFGVLVIAVFDMISSIWTNTLEPVFAASYEAISNLAKLFGDLWAKFVGPVVKNIGDSVTKLWKNTLRPIIENIMGIVGGLHEILLALWNRCLAPLINWLVNVFGPSIANTINTIWNIVASIVSNIGRAINGLIGILRGVIDFIVGVFTGDWKRAWEGVKEIFAGIWDTIAGVLSLPINAIISTINLVLNGISGAINAVVRAINSISVDIPDWVPLVGGKHIGFNLREVGSWSIPYLANGGIATSPTMAMIGEGKYDEAIIPLGNSPQMRELVSAIVDAVNRKPPENPSSTPIQLRVYIGDREWDAFTYESAQRGKDLVGAQPIRIGG